jgi:hypothetical protein
MPELNEAHLHTPAAVADILAGHAAALHGLFMRKFADILSNNTRSLRDVSRALKAQAQCRTALKRLSRSARRGNCRKHREIGRSNYSKRKIAIMTKHLKKALRTAARARLKHHPKGLWSAERRARQAELIRALEPWKKSTGPRTGAGKARSAANALKHGFRSRAFIERVRQERQLIREAASAIALAKLVLGRAVDSRAITVWTADPSDAPDLILTALGYGPAGSAHTGARSRE